MEFSFFRLGKLLNWFSLKNFGFVVVMKGVWDIVDIVVAFCMVFMLIELGLKL